MKKVIGLLSVCALFLSSCTQDNPTPGTTKNPDNILVKEIYCTSQAGSGTGSTTLEFTYKGKKISNIHKDFGLGTEDAVYTYTGDLITKEESFVTRHGIRSKKWEYVYEYDANGRLEKVKFQIGAPGSSVVLFKKYTYNTDGTVLENHDPADQLTYYFDYGEIVKTVQVTPTSSTTLTYEYDTASTPFKNIIGFNKLTIFYRMEAWADYDFRSGYQHNLKSITHVPLGIAFQVNYTYDLLFHFPLKSDYKAYDLADRRFKYY